MMEDFDIIAKHPELWIGRDDISLEQKNILLGEYCIMSTVIGKYKAKYAMICTGLSDYEAPNPKLLIEYSPIMCYSEDTSSLDEVMKILFNWIGENEVKISCDLIG